MSNRLAHFLVLKVQNRVSFQTVRFKVLLKKTQLKLYFQRELVRHKILFLLILHKNTSSDYCNAGYNNALNFSSADCFKTKEMCFRKIKK